MGICKLICLAVRFSNKEMLGSACVRFPTLMMRRTEV